MLILIKKIIKQIVPYGFIKKYRAFMDRNKPVRLFFNNKKATIDFTKKNYSNIYGVYYWDGKENFGDSIGPYIISKITGRPVFNILNTGMPGIMSVGSILQGVDREGLTILGSGFIESPNQEVINQIIKNKPLILSVRGKLTKSKLDEIGIETPDDEFLGDPALIMPLLYQPTRKSNNKKIGVVPHYIHKKLFEKINDDSLHLIDVQRDVESVISDIVNSKVCISTSLHGIIIAQAYGIPWLWLEIKDDNLIGDDYKFKDFFSMLDTRINSNHVITSSSGIKDMDLIELSRKAFLPTSLYDEKKILSVFTKHLNVEFAERSDSLKTL